MAGWRSAAAIAASLAASLAASGCATTQAGQEPAVKASAGTETAGKGKSAKGKAATPPKPLAAGLDPMANPNPFPSTYAPAPSLTTALKGATILTAAGARIDGGVVVMADGKILAVDGHQLQIVSSVQALAMGHGVPLMRNSLLLTPRSLGGNRGLGSRPDQPSLDNRSISAPQRANFFSSASKPRSR
jgi:hypothetical protein